MKIVDLTGKYIESVLEKNDLNEYFSSDQNLFDHYFSYWADKSLGVILMTSEEIITKKELIEQSLKRIQVFFAEQQIDLGGIEIILFAGQNTTNGHAFVYNDKVKVWIPIEAYRTKKMADIFIAHEIIHGLHYKQRPEFNFSSKDEKNNTGRELMTEGVATFITKRIENISDGDALWADYLTEDKSNEWLTRCKEEIGNLANTALSQWDKSNIPEFFMANDPKNIMNFRGGYYLGLKMIEKITNDNKLTPIELLRVSRTELNTKCLDYLSSIKNRS